MDITKTEPPLSSRIINNKDNDQQTSIEPDLSEFELARDGRVMHCNDVGPMHIFGTCWFRSREFSRNVEVSQYLDYIKTQATSVHSRHWPRLTFATKDASYWYTSQFLLPKRHRPRLRTIKMLSAFISPMHLRFWLQILLQPVHLFMPFPLSHINLNYPELS